MFMVTCNLQLVETHTTYRLCTRQWLLTVLTPTRSSWYDLLYKHNPVISTVLVLSSLWRKRTRGSTVSSFRLRSQCCFCFRYVFITSTFHPWWKHHSKYYISLRAVSSLRVIVLAIIAVSYTENFKTWPGYTRNSVFLVSFLLAYLSYL